MPAFSQQEIRDIAIALLVLTVIFSYVISLSFVESFVIIFVAFLLHELAHKFVAQKYGSVAFFKLWSFGIIIGIALMLVGIIFVAPGAVVIYGRKFGLWKREKSRTTIREMGIVSVSGPLVNIVFALVSLILPGIFFAHLAYINAFLAFFNLLPIKPLDGSKVFTWKPWFWLALQLLTILLIVTLVGI